MKYGPFVDRRFFKSLETSDDYDINSYIILNDYQSNKESRATNGLKASDCLVIRELWAIQRHK